MAKVIAERIRQGLHYCVNVQNNSNNITVTAAFGVTQLVAGEDIGLTIQKADEALYMARKLGRDQVMVWYPNMSAGE
jgi:PleD family two-component response regulator